MKMQRRYSKREVLGQLRVEYLFSTNELTGIHRMSLRWEVLAAFLKAGEGRAERLIETDGGLVFLQSIPHRPSTGAIYVYHEASGSFLWMRFDRDDDLSGREFDQVVWAYQLLKWTNIKCSAEKGTSPETVLGELQRIRQRRLQIHALSEETRIHLVS